MDDVDFARQRCFVSTMSGNGIDSAAVYQVLTTIVASLEDLRREVGDIRRELGQKADKSDVEQLRLALADYHGAVVGHGIMLTDMDERLRRVEQRVESMP